MKVLFSIILVLLAACEGKEVRNTDSGLLKKSKLDLREVCADPESCVWANGSLERTAKNLSILQGPTSETMTQFSVVAPKEGVFTFWLSDKKSVVRKLESAKKIAWTDQSFAVWNISGLNDGLSKTQRLIVLDESQNVVDARDFSFWENSGSKTRILLLSCLDDSYTRSMEKNWAKANELNPEVMIFLGDNVYVDKIGEQPVNVGSGDDIWKRYVENRNRLPVFRWSRLVPVYAVWDDHDFGKNDGDETWALKNAAFKVFRAFFPQPPTQGIYNPGPGVAGNLSLRGLSFLLLDSRSFRSPNTTKEAGELGQIPLTHFGSEQEKWIDAPSQVSKIPQFWISGDQWFGAHHKFESFENNHPKKFEDTLKKLRDKKRKVIFVSGDRHISEVQKIPKSRTGIETFEITSSPMHGKFTPGILEKFRSPLAIAESEGASQFVLLEAENKTSGLHLHIENWTDTKKGRTFILDEVVK